MEYFKNLNIGEVFIDLNGLKLIKINTAYLTKHSHQNKDTINCVLLESKNGLKKGHAMYATPEEGVTVNNENKVDEGVTVNKVDEKLIQYTNFSDIPQLTKDGSYEIFVGLKYLKDQIDIYIKEYQLNLNPDFQRGHVWTEDQQIKFIQFLLRQIF